MRHDSCFSKKGWCPVEMVKFVLDMLNVYAYYICSLVFPQCPSQPSCFLQVNFSSCLILCPV